jgi:hypothetical protein
LKRGKNLLVFGLVLFTFFLPTAFAWWNTDFAKRTNITVTNAGSDGLYNYQVLINKTYDSDMQTNFNDLRFTWFNISDSSEVEIPYWIEDKVDSSWVYVWFKVPYIRGSESETVYIYYKNSTSVSSVSNITNTFIYGVDWTNQTSLPSNWFNTSQVSYTFSSTTGISLIVSSPYLGWSRGIFLNSTFTPPFAVRTIGMVGTSDYSWATGIVTSANTTNVIEGNGNTYEFRSGSWGIQPVVSGDTQGGTYGGNCALNTPYTIEAIYGITHQNITKNSTLQVNRTGANQSVVYISYMGLSDQTRTSRMQQSIVRNYIDSEPIYSVGSEEAYCDYIIDSCQSLNETNKVYCLNNTIANSSSSCFTFTANNIILDCMGNLVDGTNVALTNGIYLTSTNNTVKNCRIQQFPYGIHDEGSSSKMINNSVLSAGYRAFLSEYHGGGYLENNTFNGWFYVEGGAVNYYVKNNWVSGGSSGYYLGGSDNYYYNATFWDTDGNVQCDHNCTFVNASFIYGIATLDESSGSESNPTKYYNLTTNGLDYNGLLTANGQSTLFQGGSISEYRVGSSGNDKIVFIDTGFSTNNIRFQSANKWFNYKNQNNWINTTVNATGTMTRKLLDVWNTTYMHWNDTKSGTFVRYNVSGLLANTKFDIFDNGNKIYTIQTDSNGKLTFNTTLNSEHEIILQEHITFLETTFNYSAVTFGTLNQSTSNNPATNQLSGVYNITVNASDPYNVTANATNLVSGAYNIPVNNLKMDTNSTAGNLAVGSAVTLSGSDQLIDTFNNTDTANFYGFWLSIPSYQYATNYQGNVTLTYVLG